MVKSSHERKELDVSEGSSSQQKGRQGCMCTSEDKKGSFGGECFGVSLLIVPIFLV